MTCSGLPWNFLRSSGSCVATPTGQVLRWQTRIMMQPEEMSGAVEKPISSAPRSMAMATSRPVLVWPSGWTMTRPRRRGDEADAGGGVAYFADVGIDFVAGELATFAGFCALGHFDLELVGVDEIFGGDAETRRGDLLDRAATPVAVFVGLEALGIFA